MKLRALAATACLTAACTAFVQCGGDDDATAPVDGGAPDTSHDGSSSAVDAHSDVTSLDAAIDANAPDARDDATIPDAGTVDAGDSGHGDASDASDANDASDASDAATLDAQDASDAGAIDASDATVAHDGGDAGSLCAFDETADGTAHLLGVYTLPATSMQVMVPYLTSQDLANAMTNGAGTTDAPGPGSGLEYAGGCTFYGVGDRGPNGDNPNGKSFPLPAYTPTVMKLRIDPSSHALLVDGVVNFVGTGGAPVTGFPNTAHDDIAYATATSTTPLPDNQDGLDTEDLRRLPNGDFAFVEEYSTSMGIVDGATGKVKVRYVPSSLALPNAHYLVKSILPPVLTQRRSNKGFEGLALSPDGKTAYAVLQTSMGDENVYGASPVNRIIRVEHFDDPNLAVVTGHFIVIHAGPTAFAGAAQKKIFYNSAAWLGADKLLLLERGPGHLHLVVTDLSNATNLLNQPAKGENDLTPESLAAGQGYVALGITPATSTDVFTSDDTPTFITNPANGAVVPDKLEGLAILNKTTVAIANDNDFGIVNANDRSRIWIVRLKAALP